MDTQAMVGLMGLTFFCNKCVEVFYRFSEDGIVSPELTDTCERATWALKSLKWPAEPSIASEEKVALFNTNEEIESFEQALRSRSGETGKFLEKLISDLELIPEKTSPQEERQRIAGELQGFFDTLGDYSFYATKDCLREDPVMTKP